MSDGRDARLMLRSRRHGALSTLSARLDGHPYGSLVPFMLDHDARPVLLVSQLAEHTRNMAADPRVSLLVYDPAQDAQAGARATLMGTATPIADQLHPRSRYLRFFPEAKRLLEMTDFLFYRIEPVTIRYIAGFGDIRWISEAEYLPSAKNFAVAEEEMLANFKRIFGKALHSLGERFQGAGTPSAMIGIDCDGFDLKAGNEILRFDFPGPVSEIEAAETALWTTFQDCGQPLRSAKAD